MTRVKTAYVVIAGLFVAAILAGVVSYYASSDPDGLNRVAIDKGIDKSETDHAVEDGPFAGYATKGIDNERLSGGLAGILGGAVVLVLAGGLTFALRKRKPVEAA